MTIHYREVLKNAGTISAKIAKDFALSEFEKYTDEHLTEDMLVPEIEIDAELYISDINFTLYSILQQFATFGPGNMSPVFKTSNVIDFLLITLNLHDITTI